MKILVTGAGGFLGLNLLERLLSSGHNVCAINDRPLEPVALDAFAALPGSLKTVTADVRDRSAVRKALTAFRPEAVLHAAAITLGPQARLASAERTLSVNTLSTQILLEEAAQAGVRRFVYPSSSAVYGPAPFAGPVTEATETAPAGLYGYTKLASELLVTEAGRSRGLETACARITALFGPWEHDTGVRETLSPPWQVAMRMKREEPIRLPDGGARDWTSGRDIAKCLEILLQAKSLPHRIYNLSLGAVWTPHLLCAAMGVDPDRSEREDPSEVAYNDDLSNSRHPVSGARFAEDFGFQFMTPAEACADYAAWLDTSAGLGMVRRTTPNGVPK